MPNDFLSFFLSWMSAPRRVGAIAPSGAALADLITREITASSGPILELGPGTGAFTYKLLKRGVRQQDLTLIEYGSDFMKLLQLRFPNARVLWMDAGRLTTERLYDGTPVPMAVAIAGAGLAAAGAHAWLRRRSVYTVQLASHFWMRACSS